VVRGREIRNFRLPLKTRTPLMSVFSRELDEKNVPAGLSPRAKWGGRIQFGAILENCERIKVKEANSRKSGSLPLLERH